MEHILEAIAQKRPVKGLDERTLKDYLADHQDAPAPWTDYLRTMGLTPPRVVIIQPVKSPGGGKDTQYRTEANLDFTAVRHTSRKFRKKGHVPRLFDLARAPHHDFLLIALNPTGNDTGHYWIDLTSKDLRVVEIMETLGVEERAGSLEGFLFGTEFPELLG